MRVFLSWSGPQSQQLAQVIYDWLPKVVPFSRPYISTRIQHGKQWGVELLESLSDCHVGIVCLTPEILEQDWIAFETGAIFAAPDYSSKLFCLLLGEQKLDLGFSPLAHFPLLTADRGGLLDLAMGVNNAALTPASSAWFNQAFSTSVDGVLTRVASIPPARLRDFELILVFPDTTVRHQVRSVHDQAWREFLEEVRSIYQQNNMQYDIASFRHLDQFNGDWIDPPPGWLSSITTGRIALLHPDWVDKWQNNAKLASEMLKQSLDIMPEIQQRWHAELRKRAEANQEIEESQEPLRMDSVFLYAVYTLQLASPSLVATSTAKLLTEIRRLPGLPRRWKEGVLLDLLSNLDIVKATENLECDASDITMRVVNLGRSWQSIGTGIDYLGHSINLNQLHNVLQQFSAELRALQPPALVVDSITAPVTEALRCSGRDELATKHQDLLTATGKHLIPWLRGLEMDN